MSSDLCSSRFFLGPRLGKSFSAVSRLALTRVLAGLLLTGALLTFTLMVLGGDDPMMGPRPGLVRGGDLLAFWDGGAILAGPQPERLYEPGAAKEVQRALFPGVRHIYRMAYPPPIYQATAQLVPLGYVRAMRLMMLITALSMALGASTLARSVPEELGVPHWMVAALLGASPAGLLLLGTGQLSGVWLACLGAGCAALLQRRDWVGGFFLGFLLLKPSLALPAFASLVLLLRGQAVLGFVFGAASITLTSLLLDGPQSWMSWLAIQSDPGDVALRMWNFPYRQITLRSAFGLLADRRTPQATALGWLGVSLGTAGVLVVARLAVVSLQGHEGDRPRHALGLGAVLSMALLTTPHLFDYDIVMHAPGWLGSFWWIASGRAARPRLGVGALLGAWVAPLLAPVVASTHIAMGTALVSAWVIWMATELRMAQTPG